MLFKSLFACWRSGAGAAAGLRGCLTPRHSPEHRLPCPQMDSKAGRAGMGESKPEPSGPLPGLREGRDGGGLFWELWLLFPALAMGQLRARALPQLVLVLRLWQAQNLWERSARTENVEFYFSQPI